VPRSSAFAPNVYASSFRFEFHWCASSVASWIGLLEQLVVVRTLESRDAGSLVVGPHRLSRTRLQATYASDRPRALPGSSAPVCYRFV